MRQRVTTVLLPILFTLAPLAGCNPGATQSEPKSAVGRGSQADGSAYAPASAQLNDSNVDRSDLPPLKLLDPLPPAPIPATFDVADLSDKVKPTVVNITTTQKVNLPQGHPFEFFFGPEGQPPGERMGAGTGFIIDEQGYIITNEHVVRDADEVIVKLADEREFSADVVGRDRKLDLALLKIKGGQKGLPAARLGASSSLRIGEHVLAVGNPFGLGHTVTLGIVSAKSRYIGATSYDDFIQTDAAINPGNSGGPLFNWRGEVVGIATAIRPGANNIGFAIPIDALKDVLPQLREKGHVVRGKLGLVFQPMSNDLATAMGMKSPRGALVAQIEAGGAAARAGLKPGDVITAVNGVEIVHAEELPRNVARNAPGAQINVTFVRDGKKQDVKATLDTLEDESLQQGPSMRAPKVEPAKNKLGVQVSNAKGGGVRIEALSPSSPLKEVRPGDVLIEVGGKAVSDVDALEKVLEKAKPGSILVAKIRRGDTTRFAPLPVPSGK